MENNCKLIEETCERLGLRLIELGIDDQYKKITIIIYKPSGISIKDCERLAKELLDDIEYIDGFGKEYSLEISSPGVNRRFKSIREYEIFSGKEIKITSDAEESENQIYTGVLKGVDRKNNILVENEYDLYKIPYSKIKKSNLIFEKS